MSSSFRPLSSFYSRVFTSKFTLARFTTVASIIGWNMLESRPSVIGSGPNARPGLVEAFSGFNSDLTLKMDVQPGREPPSKPSAWMNSFRNTFQHGHAYAFQQTFLETGPGVAGLAQSDPAFILLGVVATFPNSADLRDSVTNQPLTPVKAAQVLSSSGSISVLLGMGSRVTMRGFCQQTIGNEVVVGLAADATPDHPFSGSAGWAARVRLDTGATAFEWVGKGKGPFILDRANNYAGILLFRTMSEVAPGVLRELGSLTPAQRDTLQMQDLSKMAERSVQASDLTSRGSHMSLRLFDTLSPPIVASRRATAALCGGTGPVVVSKLPESLGNNASEVNAGQRSLCESTEFAAVKACVDTLEKASNPLLPVDPAQQGIKAPDMNDSDLPDSLPEPPEPAEPSGSPNGEAPGQ